MYTTKDLRDYDRSDVDDMLDWCANEIERLTSELDQAKVVDWKRLCIKLARHLRNTDGLGLHRWGVISMDLLAEVRAADEAAYDSEVKDIALDAQDDEASALDREFI